MKRTILLAALIGLSGACAPIASEPLVVSPAPIAQSPVTQSRDVAALAKSMANVTVLDVDRFQHTASIDGCAGAQLPAAAAPNSSQLAAGLSAAKTYSDQQKGASLLVLMNGEIIHESYNFDLDKDSLTDSYSMQKSLLALTFAAALDDGIIGSLDEAVGMHIPEWSGDPRGNLTFRQLLHMASGQVHVPFGSEASTALLWAEDINAIALNTASAGPAGKQFWYQNGNSQIAGHALDNALQSAGHKGYIEYFEKRIWCKIGGGPAKMWLDREGGSAHYFSGMFASARDWARIGELIRSGGISKGEQLISSSSLNQITAPSPTNPNYGAHIWLGNEWTAQRKYNPLPGPAAIQSEPYLADDVIFFDGFGGQRVYIVPSSGLTIVRTGMISFAYDDAVIVNAILAAQSEP